MSPGTPSEGMGEASRQTPVSGEDATLRSVRRLLGIGDADDIYMAFLAEDQKLMNAGLCDHMDPDAMTNRVRIEIEKIGLAQLPESERASAEQILWLWYHHAVGSALWRHRDRETAKVFAAKALQYQSTDNPNRITQLLRYLANDQIAEAERWAEEIGDTEKETAKNLITAYTQVWSKRD